MSFEPPTKRLTGHEMSAAASTVAPEETQTILQPSSEHATAPLDRINSLAATSSTAETLDLTARLLGEMHIALTGLSLDRNGFVTSWKLSETLAREVESAGSEMSITVRADATSLARLEHEQEERERAYAEAASRGVEPDVDEAGDEDYFALWTGTTVGEVPTVEALAAALSQYATLTPEMREMLRRDREREAHPPTAFQQMMRDLLK